MCSHPDHEVTKLPDGQVAETHTFRDDELEAYAAGGFLPAGGVTWAPAASTCVLTVGEVAKMLEDFKRYGPGNSKGGGA